MSPKVKVIVMITRLVEGEGSKRRKKADCYWPDRKVIMVELGMMVLAMAFVCYDGTGRYDYAVHLETLLTG